MIIRKVLLLSIAAVALSACSTTSDESLTSADRQDIQGDSMYDTDIQRDVLDGPEPGSQQDLVVNVGDRVFFGYDRYDLNAEARRTLELQSEWLKRFPNINITISGHADERGTREYNLALGERRANSVRSYLVALGVSPNRITTVSFGKEQPAVLGSNAESWAQNRRSVTEVEAY